MSDGDLEWLIRRGVRPAGPPPAAPVLPRAAGGTVTVSTTVFEVNRIVSRYGEVSIAARMFKVGTRYSGQSIVLRFDGHLMHAIADGILAGTWTSPVAPEDLPKLKGVRPGSAEIPLPPGPVQVERVVGSNGRISVARQVMKIGSRHAGRRVLVLIEDTCFRIMYGEEELAVRARKTTGPLTSVKITSKSRNPRPR